MIHFNKLRQTWIVLIVTISGFCSLVYQVAWDRIIRYNFGGDSVSSVIVTSTFLLGLGIGAFVFKRYKSRPIGIYANVELSIGLFAGISYFVLSRLAIFFGQFLNPGNVSVDSFRIILIVICFLVMLPPCILMGGTLPLMFNSFIDPEKYDGKKVGFIYGLNTLGASLGILSVPLFFFNNFDLPTTLFFVGGLNIALSFLIRFRGRYLAFQENRSGEPGFSLSGLKEKSPTAFLLFLSFISGFITLGMELILFRVAAVWTPSSAYNFPAILMPLLFSLSLGSLLLTQSRKPEQNRDHARVSALFLLSSIGIFWTVFFRTSFPKLDSIPKFFLYYSLLVFPYALFQGGIFPILLRMASPFAKQLPKSTGILYLINSIGAFLGGVIFQFVFFPLFGTKISVFALIFTGVTVSALIFIKTLKRDKSFSKFPNAPAYLILFFLMLILPFSINKNRWDNFTFGMSTDVFEGLEGVTGVVTIDWDKNKTGGGVYVNGQEMSALPDHPKHIRLAVYPLSWPDRRKVLVLGLGGGGMIRELAKDAQIKQIDIVDWSYELPKLLSRPSAEALLDHVLSNSKVTVFHSDARVSVSLFESKKYDVIVDNLAISHWVGATSIKSVKFFREVSRILKPTGVYILDINANGKQAFNGVIAGLIRNFNFVKIHHQGIAVSSNRAIQFDIETAAAVLESRKTELEISPPYINWLLSGFTEISKAEFLKIDPIRDELLVNEYFLWPINWSKWQSFFKKVF